MSPASKSLSPPADPLSHLQYARRALVNKVAPDHDLWRRVQPHDHGELLPEQPAGRPRAPFKVPPARNRGKEPGDPTMVLERHLLARMWNEKYHFNEWNRVRDKMTDHRKKLRMKERPYKDGDSCMRSRQDGSDNSSNDEWERPGRRFARKRRRSDANEPDAGNESSGEEPANNKRRRLDSECREGERSHLPSARTSNRSMISSDGSTDDSPGKKKEDHRRLWAITDDDRCPSPLETLNSIADGPARSLVAGGMVPPPLFPTAKEIVEAIPASGLSMYRITKLFWDRVSTDMDRFFCLLHAYTNVDLDRGSIRRREAPCGVSLLEEPVADSTGANDQAKFSEMSMSEAMEGRNICFGDGSAVGTRVRQTKGRSLARRGGLDGTRHGRWHVTSMRRKLRRNADDVHV